MPYIDIFGTPNNDTGANYNISVSSNYGIYYGYKAFGQYEYRRAWVGRTNAESWVRYDFTNGKKYIVKALKFLTKCALPEGGYQCQSMQFQGSNDNFATYGTIYSFSGTPSETVTEVDLSSNNDAYAQFRFVVARTAANTWNPGLSNIIATGEPAANEYYVRYNSNGGYGTMSDQVMETGVSTQLNKNIFGKRNYTFLGWDTSAAATTVVYTDQQAVTDIAQAGQTIDLYAVWRKSWAYLLMDDNGDYYSATQSGATQTLVPLSGISTLTAAVFYGQGFQFLPNNATMRSLSEPTIYLWADDPWTYMDGVVNAIPYPQEIKTEVDLSAAYITGIKEFEITYTGNVNVGYTYDGSTPVSTMTAAAFLALNPDDIYTGLTSAKKLYVYFYLQDENAVLTRFTVNYKRRLFH